MPDRTSSPEMSEPYMPPNMNETNGADRSLYYPPFPPLSIGFINFSDKRKCNYKDFMDTMTIWEIIRGPAPDPAHHGVWKYEDRRVAQEILPFMNLGPFIAYQDREYMQIQDFTLLLGCRDARTAKVNLLSADKAAEELGIEAATVDITDQTDLIAAFYEVLEIVNQHMLDIHSRQILVNSQDEKPAIFKRGKVLVYCESGNERSAVCVVAYVMATYRMDVATAIRFVQAQRCCLAIDESLEAILVDFHGKLDQLFGKWSPLCCIKEDHEYDPLPGFERLSIVGELEGCMLSCVESAFDMGEHDSDPLSGIENAQASIMPGIDDVDSGVMTNEHYHTDDERFENRARRTTVRRRRHT